MKGQNILVQSVAVSKNSTTSGGPMLVQLQAEGCPQLRRRKYFILQRNELLMFPPVSSRSLLFCCQYYSHITHQHRKYYQFMYIDGSGYGFLQKLYFAFEIVLKVSCYLGNLDLQFLK